MRVCRDIVRLACGWLGSSFGLLIAVLVRGVGMILTLQGRTFYEIRPMH